MTSPRCPALHFPASCSRDLTLDGGERVHARDVQGREREEHVAQSSASDGRSYGRSRSPQARRRTWSTRMSSEAFSPIMSARRSEAGGGSAGKRGKASGPSGPSGARQEAQGGRARTYRRCSASVRGCEKREGRQEGRNAPQSQRRSASAEHRLEVERRGAEQRHEDSRASRGEEARRSCRRRER